MTWQDVAPLLGMLGLFVMLYALFRALALPPRAMSIVLVVLAAGYLVSLLIAGRSLATVGGQAVFFGGIILIYTLAHRSRSL